VAHDALGDNGDAVSHGCGKGRVLLGQEHGQAFPLHAGNGGDHLLDDDRGQPFGRFIEQNGLRVAH
jgi:hypothetical protein